MKYPYGYCGMPCALCSRYRTDGKSRCEGCSAGGYYTDVCKVHDCCKGKALSHCGSCAEYPCVRLGKMSDFRDLNTDNVKLRTCGAVAKTGLEAWYGEYAERANLLTEALARYNDGRMKRFLCELFIQKNIETLRQIMQSAESISGTPKERGRAFRELTESILKENK